MRSAVTPIVHPLRAPAPCSPRTLAWFSKRRPGPKLRDRLTASLPFPCCTADLASLLCRAILEIEGLWHPCAVAGGVSGAGGSSVIPNDLRLGSRAGDAPRAVLLTGPNMGGKSTLLRAACVAVVLAQSGAMVPCTGMILSPVDTIFTRIGASDRILSGESTFMARTPSRGLFTACHGFLCSLP